MLRIVTAIADVSGDVEAQKVEAKALANDRKIFRLLANLTYAGFSAAIKAFDALPEDLQNAEKSAVFTVSKWLPAPTPDPDRGDTHYDAYLYLQENSAASEWLKNMASETLCQLAITRQLQGPNTHIVGGADALPDIFTLIEQAFLLGEATVALLLGFDPVDDERRLLAMEIGGRAVALTITLAEDDAEGEVIVLNDTLDQRSSVNELATWAEIFAKGPGGVLIDTAVPAKL